MEMSLPIGLGLVRERRLPWRAALATSLGALAVVGGWLWVRDSSLVSVRAVQISGVHGPQAGSIEHALRASARQMTTLDFDQGALRNAVASFAVVEQVRASTGFPHSVRIQVVERSPVLVLQAAGGRTAVAADGTALGTQLASSGLPVVDGAYAPIPGQRVSDAPVLEAASVLGAAPPALARLVARAYTGPEGLTLQMRNGLLVYFGDGTRPHAKWLSLASVLADPSAADARYVDVRVPERPAAGTSVVGSTGGSSSLAATLAERLAQKVGLAGTAGTSTGESSGGGAGESGSTPAGESGAGTAGGLGTTGENSSGRPGEGQGTTGENGSGATGESGGSEASG
jgi:cell division protein FtsQ